MTKKTLLLQFNIGQTVYVKTDIDQLPRIVYGIEVYGNDLVAYKTSRDREVSTHYGFELTEESDIMIKTNN